MIFISFVCFLIVLYWQFNAEMNQQRSNGSTRVRQEAGTAIFNCKDSDLETGESRFKTFGKLIGWQAKRKNHYFANSSWAAHCLKNRTHL